MADTARKALLTHGVKSSIRACGTPGHSSSHVSFRCESTERGPRLAVDGVQWCGSARCPRCGPLVAGRVSDRVGEVLAAARAQGLGVALLTLTVGHDRDTDLSAARDALSDAWRRLANGGLIRRLKGEGYLGAVRVWEATAGVRTGWHLHAHALVLHRGGEAAAVAAGEALAGRWLGLLEARGWRAVRAAQDVRPVRQGDGLPDYGTKALRGWGPAAELAAGWAKEGRRPDRLSLPELLGLAATGDAWAAGKYAEAVAALKGQRLFCVGPALKRALGLVGEDVQAEGEDVAPEERPGEVVGRLGAYDWREAAKRGRRGVVAALVWRRCVEGREAWEVVAPMVLDAIHGLPFRPPD